MSELDDELEREVRKLLDPRAEQRRHRAIQELHHASGWAVLLRMSGASLGIAVVLLLYYTAGAALLLDSLVGMCRAVGICG
jgi:hypothetical protein